MGPLHKRKNKRRNKPEELPRKKQLLISKQWTSPWSVNTSNELETSRLWIQFCEGVVRIVEGSGYLNTSERLPVARLILRINSFEGFLRLRAENPVTHHRVLSAFPRIHTELVVIREIPSADFTSFSDTERSWVPGQTSLCFTLLVGMYDCTNTDNGFQRNFHWAKE